eukprot:CAMPEP_0172164254 /NCGR_PEP_ID=MMETSP1050-20130122/7741_1 /TAXON_ID=233186 /ORGANISM="Cryptomonas curvata, Strain CCAP979/52" /LENGTH=56 /DNA_ID=CAMNT_0012834567 /DNA_START=157 /DNA_END=324 /DNA_ORIENTATION=+
MSRQRSMSMLASTLEKARCLPVMAIPVDLLPKSEGPTPIETFGNIFPREFISREDI